MPVSEDQLRQLLTERSDPARRRPVPEERIAVRIRRARVRRSRLPPAGSHPIDVMASCDHRKGTTFVMVKVNGNVVGFADCQGPLRLTGLPVHPGERVRVTFAAGSPIGSRIAGWQFAAYALQAPWVDPAAFAKRTVSWTIALYAEHK